MSYADIKFQDLELFVSLVELPSIARVAERFETTSSSISRRLKAMEDALGVRLIDRTTRRKQITTSGEQFYQHCQLMLREMETLTERIDNQRELPEGHITVYAPSELFEYLINELTFKFTENYPNLRV